MAAPTRFLLYIDILGFSEMVRKEPRKVVRTYAILDTLHVHSDSYFKCIVFSDTVLVYNPQPAKTDKEREDYVWYLTEFAEDLNRRLTGQDIYFRSIITAGDFWHTRLKNVECFFGNALVSAYMAEKNVPSLGLFMDDSCIAYNRFFRLEPFGDGLNFVYLNRALESLTASLGGIEPNYPFDGDGLDLWSLSPDLPWDAHFLADVHRNMRTHPSAAVRTKFLTAWDFYQRRYPKLVAHLLANNFDVDCISTVTGHWDAEKAKIKREIKYFKRIASGTELSRQVTGLNSSRGTK